MALDFFGVRLAGRIIQYAVGESQNTGKPGIGESQIIDLWVEPQKTSLNTDFRALSFVSEINVKYKLGENCVISLVLTPPFEDGLRLLQSDLIRFGIGRLEVELGYTTGTSTGPGDTALTMLPFSGFLQYPTVNIGSDITITLNAYGVGYQFNMVGGVETQSFPEGTTYAQAIEQTVAKYIQNEGSSSGLDARDLYEYIPVERRNEKVNPFWGVPTPESTNNLSKKMNFLPDANVAPGIIWKGPRNDWWFVREMLDNFKFDLLVEGNKIRVVEKDYWIINSINRQKNQRKHFVLRGPVDPSRFIYPILSFQSQSNHVFAQPGLERMVLRDEDPAKEEEGGAQQQASSQETPIARGKKSGDLIDIIEKSISEEAEAEDAARQLAGMLPGSPDSPEMQVKVESHWTDMNLSNGVQAQITTLGIPSLVPGDSVQVSGFETDINKNKDKALFNGVYGVLEVNHKIGVGGWETSFLGAINVFPTQYLNALRKAEAEEAESPFEVAVLDVIADEVTNRFRGKAYEKIKQARQDKSIVAESEELPSGDVDNRGSRKTVTPKSGE